MRSQPHSNQTQPTNGQRILRRVLTNFSPLRMRREGGAVAVEFTLVALLLVPMLFGAIDFGLLYQKRQDVESAARQGARQAGSSCLVVQNSNTSTCMGGSRSTDDASVLIAIGSVIEDVDQLESIIVYNSVTSVTDNSGATTTITDGRPIAACEQATPGHGIEGYCNVYGPDDVKFAAKHANDKTKLNERFGCTASIDGGTPDNSGNSPSSFWCPLDRGRSIKDATYVGVEVKLTHPHLTGFFGGAVHTASHSVFRLEPDTTALGPIVAGPTPPPPPSATTTTTPAATTTTTTLPPAPTVTQPQPTITQPTVDTTPDTQPVVTQPTAPPDTQPVNTQSTAPPDTQPIDTQPTAPPDTQPPATQLTTPPTQPTTPPTQPTQPTAPPTKPTQPTAPPTQPTAPPTLATQPTAPPTLATQPTAPPTLATQPTAPPTKATTTTTRVGKKCC
jgi:TadE-like protein